MAASIWLPLLSSCTQTEDFSKHCNGQSQSSVTSWDGLALMPWLCCYPVATSIWSGFLSSCMSDESFTKMTGLNAP